VSAELAAGFLFLLGLLTPLATLLALATMAVAIAKVHGPKGFFIQNGGYEYNLVLSVAAVALAVTGPGAVSLDHVLGLAR
jgi:putative oxidoreductase